jgi:hypothetical protein
MAKSDEVHRASLRSLTRLRQQKASQRAPLGGLLAPLLAHRLRKALTLSPEVRGLPIPACVAAASGCCASAHAPRALRRGAACGVWAKCGRYPPAEDVLLRCCPPTPRLSPAHRTRPAQLLRERARSHGSPRCAGRRFTSIPERRGKGLRAGATPRPRPWSSLPRRTSPSDALIEPWWAGAAFARPPRPAGSARSPLMMVLSPSAPSGCPRRSDCRPPTAGASALALSPPRRAFAARLHAPDQPRFVLPRPCFAQLGRRSSPLRRRCEQPRSHAVGARCFGSDDAIW